MKQSEKNYPKGGRRSLLASQPPRHIGIIMDGNRRYARSKGKPSYLGHQIAMNVFRSLGRWCLKRGVKILTIFAFSTENWQRPPEEVSFLMKLLSHALRSEIKDVHKQGIKVNILGDTSAFDKDLQKGLKSAVNLTKKNTKGILNVALNYGGRWDIVEAVKKIVARKIPVKNITEETVGRYISTAGMPDPDLIIRTSGELRVSGFLTWQSAYSELYFCPKYFPEFTEKDFQDALDEYARRQRRFGR